MHDQIKSLEDTLLEAGLGLPKFLVPKDGIDPRRWAVIACDQYTSNPDYWNKVMNFIGKEPSTARLILPEAFLNQEPELRIEQIHHTMLDYKMKRVVRELKPGFILQERTLPSGKKRHGLIVALDLSRYDHNPGSVSLIRPSEETIVERLKYRKMARQDATLETSHAIVFYDDPQHQVLKPVMNGSQGKVYDTDLMMNAGHVTGFHVKDERMLRDIADAFRNLKETAKHHGQEHPMLYVIGDGNHSLAAARPLAYHRFGPLVKNALRRYAMVELVNIHDEGVEFFPIHRFVHAVETNKYLDSVKNYFGAEIRSGYTTLAQAQEAASQSSKDHLAVPFTDGNGHGFMSMRKVPAVLFMDSFHAFFKDQAKKDWIEYIHGDAALEQYAKKNNGLGFVFPKIEKKDFFNHVRIHGTMPHKAFSVGHADDKAFYFALRYL